MNQFPSNSRAQHRLYEAAYEKRNKQRRRVMALANAARPENRAKKQQQSAIYRAKKREELRAKFREYHSRNREEYNARSAARRRERLKIDPQYKIAKNCRRRILNALSKNSALKSGSTMLLLGCSIPELKAHLESLFLPGMTWENHGFYGWHIDHIRPCASFDLTDPEQQKSCFHFTNLQPLWQIDNLTKNDQYEPSQA